MYIFNHREIINHPLHQLEFSITDICNRNCRSCSHFAPLARNANMVDGRDFVKFTKILRRVIPDVHTFWLIGGEPTLHPQYLQLLSALRSIYDDIPIGIMSNGYGVLRQKDDKNFWKTIRDNEIVWRITTYDVSPSVYRHLFERNGCKNLLSLDINNTFTKLAVLSETPQGVTEEKYERCGWERLNIFVRNGKIWKCPTCEYIDIFNMYFNKNYQVSPDDYLNIDENLTREQILKFKQVPSDFCRNCDLSGRSITKFTVGKSAKDISEWMAH